MKENQPKPASDGSTAQPEANSRTRKGTFEIIDVPDVHPTDPKIYRVVQDIILEFVVCDDASDPLSEGMDHEAYVTECARRLMGPIQRAILDAGMKVSEVELQDICKRSGSEVFVVRRLGKAIQTGEFPVGEIVHLQLYQIYQDYIERRPGLMLKVAEIALNLAAARDREAARKN
jgi:hypothetical protein